MRVRGAGGFVGWGRLAGSGDWQLHGGEGLWWNQGALSSLSLTWGYF